jgi:hypothetical protein
MALVRKDVPTDYHLEAALPGVQQRLQMLETGQSKLGCWMDGMETTVVKKSKEEGEKTRVIIAIVGGSSIGNEGGKVSQAQPDRLQKRRGPSDGGLLVLSDHQFYAKHKSVQSFYKQ